MQALLNVTIDGIAYGMVLFIISVGMSVTLGLMRFVNVSHGSFAMIGVYISAYLITDAQWSFWWSWLAAIVATAAIGGILEAIVLKHLYRQHQLEQVLFTIGLAFFLTAAANALVGPQVQVIRLPAWLSQPVDLGFRTLPVQRLLVIAAGSTVALLSFLIVSHTRFGVWLRAAVDNSETASTLGIPIRRVQCLSFAIGAALAAVGGVLGAELMPIEPYYGLKYLVLVLAIVAVGGMGSIPGSLLAALILGLVETTSKYFASDWGSTFFFLAMGGLLAWRPQGILSR
jgi:branched-chain amino acid transport system permease protein